MKTIYSLSIVLIITLLCTGCDSMQVFRLEVLKPGFIVVPSQKSNIVIVDNTGIQPEDAGHQVKVDFKLVGDTSFNTESLSGYLMKSLSNYLLKDGFYKQVKLVSRYDLLPAKSGDDDFLRSARLSNSKIMELSRDTNLHLLFSLDRLLTKTTTNTYLTGETFAATRDVWVNTVWRVYDLDVDTVITQFQYNDSLYWRKFDLNSFLVAKKLPSMVSVLPEIGDVVAENLAPFMGPHWVTEKRDYFCAGSYRMTMAADLVRKDQLDQAAELWKVEYVKGLFRSKYRAAFNMMFYEDVKGNPKEALDWLAKAEGAMKLSPTGASDYDVHLLARWKGLLKDRLDEFQKLKIYFDGNLN